MTPEILFKEIIIKNLNANGFPLKKVSLPLEKMYEVADDKGVNFNKILELLKQEGINSEKTSDKIIFSKINNTADSLYADFQNLSPAEMMKKAAEMMKSMSPEQMAEIKKQYDSMTPKQREEIMKKGKEMGF
jgi:DNA-binding transcriptional MerR regulator